MKIKLNFTNEHIALIKALNFGKLDIRDIMNSYSFVDNQVTVVENGTSSTYRMGEILDKNHVSLDNNYGFDNYCLWGGTFIWEQMAYILGYQDAIIPSTKEDPTGPKFYELIYTGIDENGKRIITLDESEAKERGLEPMNVLEHLKDLDAYMITNLKHIMDLLLQFCTEGIQTGVTYWAYDYQGIWHKEE